MKKLISLVLFFQLIHLGISTAQESLRDHISYTIEAVYPYISVSESALKEAQTISDLNSRYPKEWIKKYISTEIISQVKGKIMSSKGDAFLLNEEQKSHLAQTDLNSKITIKVNYIPKNDLKNNEAKLLDFSLSIDPDINASFPGDVQSLKSYLAKTVFDQFNYEKENIYDMGVIKFTVDRTGHLKDIHIFWDSEHASNDELMLESICNMPDWIPARYSNGLKVDQEFAFIIGNMENCVMPMLNIKSTAQFNF